MGTDSKINRRKFMEIGIYAMGGTIAVASTAALARFAVGPSFEKEKSQWVAVDIGEIPEGNSGFRRVVLEYQTKEGWLTATERKLAYVRKTGGGQIVAISADCTHLGCIVTWDEDQKIFKCPCHNGRYDAEGRVISGPPPAPLYRHETKIEEGRLLVSTEKVRFGGDARA